MPSLEYAYVRLWGEEVGVVAWHPDKQMGVFEYTSEFTRKGLDLSPIHMSIKRAKPFSFPSLPETFKGLPGLLADSLPDKFGNAVIDQWLATQGRSASDFTPIERLCYTGMRGMGALEFYPENNQGLAVSKEISITPMLALINQVVENQAGLEANVAGGEEALLDVIRVGTSAGGARAKAVIAMNEETHDIRSGQVAAPEGYSYWLLKFDGIDGTKLGDPKGFGRVEFAYSLMAKEAGIDMSRCRLLEENGRAHFMTERFDRPGGDKLHMQTLCGLAHYDFNALRQYSYEQVFAVMRKLRLSAKEQQEQFRRMVFNVVARNQDDHTKNIAFLMDRGGRWRLSPAYDVSYAYNPDGKWTSQHQLSINGKYHSITQDDLYRVGSSIGVNHPQQVVEEVITAVSHWHQHAAEAGVDPHMMKQIESVHQLFGKNSVPMASDEVLRIGKEPGQKG